MAVDFQPRQMLASALAGIEREYNATGMRLAFWQFVLVFLAIAAATAMAIAFLVEFVPGGGGRSAEIISFAAFFAILSLIIAVPISIKNNRVQQIDENLPDALKHMATVLRAGGTVESCVEEVSKSDYGPLSEELKKSLEQMKKGKTFDQVLHDTALNSGSRLFERCAIIITDAKRAGAGIAEVMHVIADDAREVTRIKRERISRTMMHVLFLYAAALVLSPFIFGFTITITNFIGTGIACAVPDSAEPSTAFLNTLLMGFLVVEAVITTFAIGVIREGKLLRHVVRVPAMVLISLGVYELGKRFGVLVIGGGGACL